MANFLPVVIHLSWFWQLVQLAHQGLALVTLLIMAISLVVIVKWPAIRGRGFIIGSFGLSAVAQCGFFGLGLIQWLVTTFGRSNAQEFYRLIQIGYLLLNLATPVSGVLLPVGAEDSSPNTPQPQGGSPPGDAGRGKMVN